MKQISKYLSAVFLAVFMSGSLVSVVGCGATETKRGTGEYVDDAVITTKVKAALVENPLTKAYQIEVETYKGVVQLSGFVATQAEANKAAELARGVNGVSSVKNDIRIR